jgi:hypothetical protein
MRKHRLTKLREAVQKVRGIMRLSPEEDRALDEIRADLMQLRFDTREPQCPPGCKGDGWHLHITEDQLQGQVRR